MKTEGNLNKPEDGATLPRCLRTQVEAIVDLLSSSARDRPITATYGRSPSE